MKIIRTLALAGLIMTLAACNSNPTSDLTTVKVKEVEQVGGYTYLLVKGKGPEYWIAVPTMDASPGDTYSYQGGMLMKDFYSQELDRTFEEVLFLEALFSESYTPSEETAPVTYGSSVAIPKTDVKVEAGEGTVTISELYADPGNYSGKRIRVKGEVTKFNPSIMERNWVHVQDGTEHEGKYDLTATSLESFEVGTVVTLEGTVALNRDFGYGYSYEILLEETTAVQ